VVLSASPENWTEDVLSTTQLRNGYNYGTQEARRRPGVVRFFAVRKLACNAAVDDWIAAAEVPDPDCNESNQLERYAQMCERLASMSVGPTSQIVESRAALWRVLHVMCTNSKGNWLSRTPAALTGQSPVTLSSQRTSESNVTRPLAPLLVPGPFGIGKSYDDVVHCAGQVENLLVNGNGEAAVDCATQNGLWSLAFAAAASVNRQSYLDVLTVFAREALQSGSALQTLCLAMAENLDEVSRIGATHNGLGKWRETAAVLLRHDAKSHMHSPEVLGVIENLGKSLLKMKDDIVGAHLCFILSGHLTRLSITRKADDPHEPLLVGASDSIPAGRPQSIGSCAAVLQSIVLETAQGNSECERYVHLLPFRLLLAEEMAVIGRCESALAHCEHLITDVKGVFGRGDLNAIQLLTPPFLASLEGLENRLRYSLGMPALDHNNILSLLLPSLSTAFQRASNGTNFESCDERAIESKQDSRGRDGCHNRAPFGSSSSPSSHFTTQLSQSSYPHASPPSIPQVSHMNAHHGRGQIPEREHDLNRNSQGWSTTSGLAPVVDTLASDDTAPSSDVHFVHNREQPQLSSAVEGHFAIMPSIGIYAADESNNHAVQNHAQKWATESKSHDASLTNSTMASGAPKQSNPRALGGSDLNESGGTHQSPGPNEEVQRREQKVVEKDKAPPSTSSRRWSIFGRLPRLISEKVTPVFGGRPQAHLGQKNSLVYNKELKRWVEEGKDPTEEDLAPPPPPDDDTLDARDQFSSEHVVPGSDHQDLIGNVQTGPTSSYEGYSEQTSFADMRISSPTSSLDAKSNMYSQTGHQGIPSGLSEAANTPAIGASSALSTMQGSNSESTHDSGVAPFSTGAHLPDRARIDNNDSRTTSAGTNRFRAGRRVGRAAYVDTFNPRSTSSASTTHSRALSIGPVPPATASSGLPYRIFTPAAVSTEAPADNVSATSESMNASHSPGNFSPLDGI
jgi:hypothetical protein